MVAVGPGHSDLLDTREVNWEDLVLLKCVIFGLGRSVRAAHGVQNEVVEVVVLDSAERWAGTGGVDDDAGVGRTRGTT